MTKYLSNEEIKTAELQMLLEFDSMCRHEGLRYSLAGGTLLGAVRHKGFIPWDDDIDVSMPRPDFSRLLSISRNTGICPEGRSLTTYSGNPEHPVFAKFVNDEIAVKVRYEGGIGHLWIDIIPIDGLPDREPDVIRIYRKAQRYRNTLALCKADSHEGRTPVKRFLKRGLTPLARSIDLGSRAAESLDGLAQALKFGETQWVGCVAWGLYGSGERYTLSGWEGMVQLPFEGHMFPAISCWDAYLHGIYGDYMSLPPEEQRKTHETKAWRVSEEGESA